MLVPQPGITSEMPNSDLFKCCCIIAKHCIRLGVRTELGVGCMGGPVESYLTPENVVDEE